MSTKITREDLEIPATFRRELAKYNARARRRWNAVPHETRRFSGGPFDWQPFASSEGGETLVFRVGEWFGRYVGWNWRDETGAN